MDQTELDQKVSVLTAHKDKWASLTIRKKIALLGDMRRKTAAVAERWVQASVKGKGIEDQPNLAVEEWLGGPYAILQMLNGFIKTLEHLEMGHPRPLKKVRTRPNGQVVVDMFPLSAYDRVLFTGMRGETWMQPGVTPGNLHETMSVFYKQSAPRGKVALVLGAGNVTSLSVADVLFKLYTEGQVCLLKMNPVNSYMGAIFEKIFAAHCKAGYVQFAYGGADTGAHLCSHPGIDEIHMTGSARTHDAIVYGTGPDAPERKRDDRPINTRRITSELGCVTPTIVVPGPWTDADLRYHAEHIVTQKYNNAGHNCLAAQVLILSESWDKTSALLDAIRTVMREIPARPTFYPGAAQRHEEIMAAHPHAELLNQADLTREDFIPRLLVTHLDPGATEDICFTREFFNPALAQVTLPGDTPTRFLRHAVRFANGTLDGTLSANLIIHPETMKALGPALEDAIAALRYGSIGVNCWAAYGFLLSMLTWGAFPGHTRNDIQSGTGAVHNTFMFDRPQKSVLYAPFRMRPKPAFVTHHNGNELGRRTTAFEANPSITNLSGVVLAALKG